jgi:hypothetical protein
MLRKFCKNSSGVKVVDGKLILSFPQATRPVLWHMDLGQTKTCSFEIREGEKEGDGFSLIMKKEGDQAQEIASFNDPDTATEALISVGSALEKNRGFIPAPAMGQEGYGASQGGGALKFIGTIAGVIILLFLIGSLMSLAPKAPQSIRSATTSDISAKAKSASETVGAPVSADDFLMGR